jgi:DNA-binding HxlR family transcriptional regulator
MKYNPGEKYRMETNSIDKGSSLRNYFQMLFKSETRSLIVWNLIIHKELTVKQLKELINKDTSTITRNLRNLEKEGLVLVSKTETIRNITINFWKLTPKDHLSKFGDFDKIIKEALISKDLDLMKLTLLAIQRNLENLIGQKSRNIGKFVQNIIADKELMSIGLMDKETGEIFRKELNQFLCKFQEEHNIHNLPLDEISPESFFTFILTSPFPSLNDLTD